MRKQIFVTMIVSFIFLSIGMVHSETTSTQLEYSVLGSNETVNGWYNPDGTFYSNYTIANGSVITIDFQDVTDFNSHLNITVGNITVSDILDSNVDGALTLGYWQFPNTFGFVANNSWDAVTEDFMGLDKINPEVIKNSEYEVLGGQAGFIEFKLDDGVFQQTHLVYDENGILVYAKTKAGNFHLELEIKSLNSDTEYYKNTLPFSFSGVFLGLVISPIFFKKRSYLSDSFSK